MRAKNLTIKRGKIKSLEGGACVCVFHNEHISWYSLKGEKVPFDALVAMVTARVCLCKERQNGNVRSLCNFSWHPGCINVKFLFLESTCSWTAYAPFSTSCFLDCKLTWVLLMRPSKPRGAETLSHSSPRWNRSVKPVVESSLKGCMFVGWWQSPCLWPFNPVVFQVLATVAMLALLCGCSLRSQISHLPLKQCSCAAQEDPIENWDGFLPTLRSGGAQSLYLQKQNQVGASLCWQREMVFSVLLHSTWR